MKLKVLCKLGEYLQPAHGFSSTVIIHVQYLLFLKNHAIKLWYAMEKKKFLFWTHLRINALYGIHKVIVKSKSSKALMNFKRIENNDYRTHEFHCPRLLAYKCTNRSFFFFPSADSLYFKMEFFTVIRHNHAPPDDTLQWVTMIKHTPADMCTCRQFRGDRGSNRSFTAGCWGVKRARYMLMPREFAPRVKLDIV